jgi:hypothetical protein
MYDPSQTCADNSATTSLHSAVSGNDDEEAVSPLTCGKDTLIKSFCLNIEKLEKVASATKEGMSCRIRRNRQLEKATYFLLRADFVDGTSWDVIIPHPDTFPFCHKQPPTIGSNFRGGFLNSLTATAIAENRMPKLIGQCTSTENDAGVAYFFVDSISGTAKSQLD